MDEYDEGCNAEWREAMRQLRARVWEVRSPDDLNRYLLRVRQSVEATLPGLVAWRLFRVEEGKEVADWSMHALTPDSYWLKLGAAVQVDSLLAVWRVGGIVQRAVEGGREAEEIGKMLGRGAASMCQIPFEQGVLVLYGRVGVVVPDEWAEDLREISQNLFFRLVDLELLRDKEAELRRIQRLQVAGKLTAEIAHEINNPLSVVIGESSLLMDEKELDPMVVEGVEAIYKAGLQARDISERLLNFVRGQKVQKEWINFNRLVQESVVLVRRTLQNERIEIVEELAPNLPWIEAHLGQLQQVALNLIQNSRDATREHGGRIVLRTLVRQGWAVFEVEDDGPGIPLDIREHVFEPFFTTKSDGEGTGLGLSVCMGIARDHGGRLMVADCDEGARIVLELPVQQATLLVSN